METFPRHHLVARRRLVVGLAAGATLSIGVIVSGWGEDTGLGAPRAWPWLLTGLQVLAMWSAGQKLWWGWLLGGMVQIPWIAYAWLTGQFGFIPGCAISALVQIFAFRRNAPSHRTEVPRPLQEART
jgi:hypothetical protein